MGSGKTLHTATCGSWNEIDQQMWYSSRGRDAVMMDLNAHSPDRQYLSGERIGSG